LEERLRGSVVIPASILEKPSVDTPAESPSFQEVEPVKDLTSEVQSQDDLEASLAEESTEFDGSETEP